MYSYDSFIVFGIVKYYLSEGGLSTDNRNDGWREVREKYFKIQQFCQKVV
jgi:hypothetical protein